MAANRNGTAEAQVVREMKQQFVDEAQDPSEWAHLGDYSNAFLYVNSSYAGTGVVSIEVLTAVRRRASDAFKIHTFAIDSTTTATYVYLQQLGSLLGTKSKVPAGDDITWESLVASKM